MRAVCGRSGVRFPKCPIPFCLLFSLIELEVSYLERHHFFNFEIAIEACCIPLPSHKQCRYLSEI